MQEHIDFIIEHWGDAGKNVVAACKRVSPFGGSMEDFFDHCTGWGGRQTDVLLTGIRELFPEVFNVIPGNMDTQTLRGLSMNTECLFSVLHLCGVD